MGSPSIASLIDQTLLKPTATRGEVEELCTEAKRYGFASVCVAPCHVSLARRLLEGTGVKVCTVVGFPLGSSAPEVKAFEALRALEDGALELDVVMNLGALKSGDYELVRRDIGGIVEVAKPRGALVKVIIETCYLSDEEKVMACRLAKEAGADFVKTSTGFGPVGATTHDVRLLRKAVGPNFGVKASGGIRTLEDAVAMVEAGANRIGTSDGVAIAEEERSKLKPRASSLG